MVFTLSGSQQRTQQILRQKALRAYFGMKKYVNTKNVPKSATFKLFDSLIVPVATKRMSNAAVYGDTGRIPLVLSNLKQFVNFFNRLSLLDRNDSNNIARHAFAEQKQLKLPWYTAVQSQLDPRMEYVEEHKTRILPNALLCEKNGQIWFSEAWKNERQLNKKLKFYCSLKENLGFEPYIKQCSHKTSEAIEKLRISSHGLNIEAGRYGAKYQSKHNRCCPTCTDLETLELILELPGEHNPIIEDELHVLKECPLYEDIRTELDNATLTHISSGNLQPLFNEYIVTNLANYINKIFKLRFPKTDPKLESHNRKTM